jgi:hypothetical protein
VVWCAHCSAIVWGTPTTAVNGYVLEAIVESSGFVHIADSGRENSNTSNLGIVGNANTTCVVTAGSDLASATSAMVVVGFLRIWKRLMVIEIIRIFGRLQDVYQTEGEKVNMRNSRN